MKNLILLSLLFLFTFAGIGECQYSAEMNKFALMLYLKNDPQTAQRFEEINTLLSNPENYEKIASCAATAMNYIIAKDVLEVNKLNVLMYKLAEDFGKPQYEEIFQNCMKNCGYDDGFVLEQLNDVVNYYPPYEKIKPAADFFILALKDGQNREKILETMEMLYPDEMLLLNKAFGEIQTKYKKDNLGPVHYLTFLYRMDYLKQLKEKMYDVEKYAANDLEFCKSKILKMLDGKDDVTTPGTDDGVTIKDNSGDNKGVPHYELETFTVDPDGKSGNVSTADIKSLKITAKGFELVIKNTKVELLVTGGLPKEIKEGGSSELNMSLKMTGSDNDIKVIIVFGGATQENDFWVGKSKSNNFDRQQDKQVLTLKPVTKKSKGQVVEVFLNLWGYDNPILIYRIVYKFVNN